MGVVTWSRIIVGLGNWGHAQAELAPFCSASPTVKRPLSKAPVGNVPLEEPKVTEQAPVGNVPLEEPKVTLSDFLKTVDQHNWYTSFAFTIGTTILTLGLGLGGLLLFRNVRELKADLESDLADANKKVNEAIELVEKKAAEVDDLKTKLAEARTSLERDYRQKAGAGFCFITLELGVVLHKLSQADLSTPEAISGLLKHPAERFLSWTLERASQAKGLFTYRPEDRADELPLLANLAVYETSPTLLGSEVNHALIK